MFLKHRFDSKYISYEPLPRPESRSNTSTLLAHQGRNPRPDGHTDEEHEDTERPVDAPAGTIQPAHETPRSLPVHPAPPLAAGPSSAAQQLQTQRAATPSDHVRSTTPDFGPVPGRSTNTRGYDFTARDLYHVAAALVKINPWAAPHGQKRARWTEALQVVQEKGCCSGVSQPVFTNKANAMVDYQDGASRKAEPKLNAMLDSPAGYRLGGLLDQLSEHRRTAEEAADTKSAKQQKKQQEDLTGGEIARFAALRGMKRAHSDSAINKENGGGDIQTLFEDSCPVRKRPKAGDEQLRAMLEANAQRDEEFRRNVITRLDEGNKIQQEANRLYAHAQQDLVSILQKALQQEHAG